MKRFAFLISMFLVLTTQTASAQTLTSASAALDHLVCYRMLDKLKLNTTTDMIAQLQPEFTQRGCILIKPIEFCVPATKINVSPVPPNPNVVGTSLRNDYICYKAKCKNPLPPPDKQVIDQFGSRLHQNYELTKLCVPAQKAPAGCPVGPITNGGMCQGACPNPTDLCKVTKVGGVKQCLCVHQNTCGGQPDAAGHCGGDCPIVGEVCLPTLTGTGDPTTTKLPLKCTCRKPVDPICGLDPATGSCGGACPKATDKCMMNAAGQCSCAPENPPCQASTDAAGGVTCGGACPLATQQCKPDTTTGKCSCQPEYPCSQDPVNGACGGGCPVAGDVCALDSTGHCSCQQSPCGNAGTTPPSCGGACPFAGQTCALDATGACNCQPPTPCGSNGANSCGGFCPAPGLCRQVPGTTICQCQ